MTQTNGPTIIVDGSGNQVNFKGIGWSVPLLREAHCSDVLQQHAGDQRYVPNHLAKLSNDDLGCAGMGTTWHLPPQRDWLME